MDQSVIDQAVNIATRNALNGHPVERVTWIPPTSATQDSGGAFAIKYCEQLSASQTSPWDR
ncbi:MAG: hypothetical protein IMZ43_09900 [Thermoplasmata archaeon]|nr:hypothetical protein [Thermoplasmata archaeon]